LTEHIIRVFLHL